MTETVIKPKVGLNINFRELWNYRELLYIFTWRDIKVRYKQTVLGIVWVLFQPLITTAIFSIFFGKLAKIPSGNLPYPLFIFIGLVVWNFFSSALTSASLSMVSYEGMIKKVYFPRLLIPLSAIFTAMVDFGVTLIFLIVFLLYYRIIPNPIILVAFPMMVIILAMLATGISLFTSAVNVKYRDVRFVLPFFIQIGMFVSPVIFPINVIQDYRKYFLYLNPLTGIIEGTRALVSNSSFDWSLLIISFVISLISLAFGLFYFNRAESYFADIS